MGSLLEAMAAASAQPLVGTAVAVFVSAILRGFTGFGFALTAVPLMSLSMPPAAAVPIAVGLQLCAGLMDLPSAGRACHWPSLRWLIPAATLASPVGVLALVAAEPAVARLLISLICLLGVLLLVRGFRLQSAPGGAGAGLVGVVAGLFNGLAAMPGPPVVSYYLASPLSAETSRASLLVFFLATSIAAACSLVTAGLLGRSSLMAVLLGLPLLIVGNLAGRLLFRRLAGRGHRLISTLILAGVALVSAGRALLDLL